MSTRRLPRFFVSHDAIVADRAVLSGSERHHLRVRRIRPGGRVELYDDRGRVFEAIVSALTADRVELAITKRVERTRESPLDLTLAVALLKADKIDLVVEKATELGVTRIVLFTCERALGGSSRPRRERWQRIAASAATQCGRSGGPVIEGPESLDQIAARSAELRLVCWEDAPPAAALPLVHRASSVLIAVGPEGGFTEEDVTRLQDSGFRIVSLGPRILRAETAAITAAAIAQMRWGDLAGTR